jgi:hypothetical protein
MHQGLCGSLAVTGVGRHGIGLGFIGGVLVERVRFDHRRSTPLGQYGAAIERWHAHLLRIEQGAVEGSEHDRR